MKHFKTIAMFLLIMSLQWTHETTGNNDAQAAAILEAIQKIMTEIKQEQTEGIVSSPAVRQDQLIAIVKKSKQLEKIKQGLSSADQTSITNNEVALLNNYTPALKTVIKSQAESIFKNYGRQIAESIGGMFMAGVTSAAIELVSQSAKIGMGNLINLDTNTLLSLTVNGITINALQQLSHKLHLSNISTTLLSNTGGEMIIQSLSPYYTNQMQGAHYRIPLTIASNPISTAIKSEFSAIFGSMISNNLGEITKNINLKSFLLGPGKGPMGGELVAALQPQIKTIVYSDRVASALAQASWIVLKSAAVGGLLYFAGFGYAGSTTTESIYYSMVTGIAQDAIAVGTTLTGYSAGSIVEIASAPLGNLVALQNANPQAAATALVQATVGEVVNLIADQSNRAGGIAEVIRKGKNALGDTIQSRWSTAWSYVSGFIDTMNHLSMMPKEFD